MSVMAAAVKTMLAQKPRTGVGESSSHTKNGMATMRPIVRRFGTLTASSASDRRRLRASLRLGASVMGPSSPDAYEDRALPREADEAALPAWRLGGRKGMRDEAAEPPHDPFAPHEQRPARRALDRGERSR